MRATALIAEDEPLLAAALQAELARAWPQLQVLATVGDGASAVAQALALQPTVLFFDIRMPGMGGLEAAAALAEDWPSGQAFPQLVFVTAYDHYALQAFEAQAVDYLLKPVQTERLQRTVARVQARLQSQLQTTLQAPLQETKPAARRTEQAQTAINFEAQLAATVQQLQALLAPQGSQNGPLQGMAALGAHGSTHAGTHAVAHAGTAAPAPRLSVLQASVGNSIHMVPLDHVLYFEAADKYLRVLARNPDGEGEREYWLRTPLKELLPQLDAQAFVQIHRGTVVRAAAIASVLRDDEGKLSLRLHGSSRKLPVSRLYVHLFKAM